MADRKSRFELWSTYRDVEHARWRWRLACRLGWHNLSCWGRLDHTVVEGRTVRR